jgi:hypothetical protein
LPENCAQIIVGRERYTFACNFSSNFDQARELCQRSGADLVTPLGEADNTALHNAMRALSWGGDFWLGFRDPDGSGDNPGAYVGVQSEERFWSQGEPNENALSCARYRNRDDARWHDKPCRNAYRFICEVQP